MSMQCRLRQALALDILTFALWVNTCLEQGVSLAQNAVHLGDKSKCIAAGLQGSLWCVRHPMCRGLLPFSRHFFVLTFAWVAV